METNSTFKGILENLEVQPNGKYDCLVPVSGGKDGIYVLDYLKKNTNLRLLAFHIDNFYVAEEARKNIFDVCDKLNIDVLIYRPAGRDTCLFNRHLLEKMGEICIFCEYLVTVLPLTYALDMGIPNVAYGLAPNQLLSKGIAQGYGRLDLETYLNYIGYYRELFRHIFADNDNIEIENTINNWFTANTSYSKFPSILFPFYFTGYDAIEIENTVTRDLGWHRSGQVGGTSSNCTINKLHIYLKRKVYGDDFYLNKLENKLGNKEVNEDVVKHALQDCDFSCFKQFLSDMDINCGEEELVNKIKNYKKTDLLNRESNISI